MNPLMLWLGWKFLTSQGGKAGPQWPGQRHPPPAKPPKPRKAPRGAKPPAGRPAAPAAPAAPLASAPADAAPLWPPRPAPVPTSSTSSTSSAASTRVSVPVLTVQKVANGLGVRPPLTQDGLFGPKTVNAWRQLARSRGLNDTIARLGPKTVDVDRATYARLNASRVSGDLYIP